MMCPSTNSKESNNQGSEKEMYMVHEDLLGNTKIEGPGISFGSTLVQSSSHWRATSRSIFGKIEMCVSC